MNYKDQINDSRWKEKAKEIKTRDNYTCQVCGSTHNLHVHHVAYDHDRLAWEYTDTCLITICGNCHKYEHECKKNINTLLINANLSGMLYSDIYAKLKPLLDF